MLLTSFLAWWWLGSGDRLLILPCSSRKWSSSAPIWPLLTSPCRSARESTRPGSEEPPGTCTANWLWYTSSLPDSPGRRERRRSRVRTARSPLDPIAASIAVGRVLVRRAALPYQEVRAR